jgi:tetratricopeptide (TPR) repeat protein
MPVHARAYRTKRRRRREADPVSLPRLEPVRGGSVRSLPAHTTGEKLQRAEVLRLQQLHGNSATSRILQRERGPETPEVEARRAHARAQAAYNSGDYPTALAVWRRAYSLPQTGVQARGRIAFNMARTLQQLGRNDEALSLLQEALLASPGDRADILELMRQVRSGVEVAAPGETAAEPTAAERAAADEQARTAIAAGDAAGRGGDLEEALAQFDAAYALRAASSGMHTTAAARRGHALRELGRSSEAISAFQEALGAPDLAEDARLYVLAEIRHLRSGQAAADVERLSEDEQHALFQQAQSDFRSGNYQAALEKFEQIYAQPDARTEVRRQITYDMGLAHQRLQEFEAAANLFQEALLFSGWSEEARAEALDRLRQCRMGELGPNVQSDDLQAGDETLIFSGQVFFETGRAVVSSLGSDTIQALAALIRERHGAEPGRTFRIAVVGGATRRWRSADGDAEAERRNQELAEQRSDAVAGELQTLLPVSDLGAGVYTIEPGAMGDQTSAALGLDSDDNTWTLRSVAVSVWTGGGTPGGGAQ